MIFRSGNFSRPYASQSIKRENDPLIEPDYVNLIKRPKNLLVSRYTLNFFSIKKFEKEYN